MIQENFTYAGTYTSLVGMPTGVYGHLKLWNDSGGRFLVYLLFMILLLFLIAKKRSSKEFGTFLACFAVLFSVGLFLMLTMLWWHHLEILSLVVLFGSIFVFNFVNDNSETSSGFFNSIAPVFGLILVLLNAGAAGMSFDPRPSMKFSSWVNPAWTLPIEISALNSVSFQNPNSYRLARLGINDELGFIAFLPDKWKFDCARLGILGWESSSALDEHLRCLSEKPNVILVSDMHNKINLTSGNFPEFKNAVEALLDEKFKCRLLWDTQFKVCVRKDEVFTWNESNYSQN
jgi:hypothetical protein